MRISWKVGRVAGIDLYIHPSFLIVLAFPQVIGGGALSVLLILSVFGCVLLHELGHAMMARRFGIETEDITLYPIGGVARLSRMPRAPGAELLIALAGPAVNVAIVAALVLFRWASFSFNVSAAEMTTEWTDALIRINLMLAVFNMIPAFPMDG